MNTNHKLDDQWLLSYATGSLSPAQSLMVSSHMAFHDDMQETVSQAEFISGALFQSMDAARLPNDMLDNILDKLDSSISPEVTPIASTSSDLPQPVLDFIGNDTGALKWKFSGRGIRSARLWNGPNDERLWLLEARNGTTVPEHGHNGIEWTLILKGSYETDLGKFRSGDIDIADENIEHQPVSDEGCMCLVMTSGPVKLKSLVGRIAQPFIGL
ncbi:MAG: ChrR family anti-sigma-E factor [Pseudomonadota bacterium]|nr:ChrR family anti-sigma-E factor [Pseudomonadota bacterium]